MNDATALKADVRARLLSDPASVPVGDRLALRAHVSTLLADRAPLLAPGHVHDLLDEIVRDLDGLGVLELVLADPEVSEIMLNRPGRAYVERRGRIEPLDLDLTAEQIVRIAERVIAPLGLRLDRSSPIVDARLPDGSRLHAVLPPLAPDGPCVTIRRFLPQRFGLEDFGVPHDVAALIESMVGGGCNLLVAGGTSTGKTTLLSAVARAIDASQRIVTIEETAELALDQPHVVRLEARPANGEGAGAVTIRELVRASLRMRPDRLIVGEVRGPEAIDLLQALNTGHDGSMCTVHANSAAAALVRLETLALMGDLVLPVAAVRAQLAAALDAVIFVVREADGRRRIDALAEVVDPGDRDLARRGVDVLPLAATVDGRLQIQARPARVRRPRGSSLDRRDLGRDRTGRAA